MGNWYKGPELEMWSLGVTLYTFIFGEHPFFEVEETIQGELFPPFKVSNELMFALCWMLNIDVACRARIKDLLTYPWFTRAVDVTKYSYNTVLGVTSTTPRFLPNDDAVIATDGGALGEEDAHSNKSSTLSSTSSSDVSSDEEGDDVAGGEGVGDKLAGGQLLQENYEAFLGEPLDLRTEDVLSKSF